ncbi:DUF6415 family natural product biosynthesis protein [Streptomyces sp. NPDC005407]|uniref:DUF6415 family natural product biosynthesis protein n=1 Tax=Streptomyces sp. NPDC005407 TaxID=3155340 RepID=UPI0033B16F22
MDALTHLLGKMTGWTPYDAEALLDDVGDALDDLAPDRTELPVLVQRLQGHLKQLENIAIAAKADQRDAYAATLIERSRGLRAKAVPSEFDQAKGYMLRVGWVVSELVDRLVATQCLKGAA